MLTTMKKRTTEAAGLALLLFLSVAGGALIRHVRAQEAKDARAATIWIAEVDRDAETGEVHLLLNVGREAGLERGDGISIEREGKPVARATVFASYADMAIATVDTGTGAGTVARGDWVRATSKGKKEPRAPEGPMKVLVTGGGLAVDAGADRGLRAGQEAIVIREGRPIGRVKVESVTRLGATIRLVEGEATSGDTLELAAAEHERPASPPKGGPAAEPDLSHEELRRLERESETPRGMDFVSTSFLGVVAELEHPITANLAPCHIGVLVRRVVAGSPAEKAQIRPGDRVIAIDDRIVRTPVEIHRGVKRRSGDFIKVTIARDDTLQTLSADFRKRY
jgi:hypothetical protein